MADLPSRVLHSVAFAPRGGLPARHWRLIWLGAVVRVLIAFPLVCILVGPYAVAQAYIWLTDRLGGALGKLYVTCYNRDLARSGWQPPAARRARAPRLDPSWLAGKDGPDG